MISIYDLNIGDLGDMPVCIHGWSRPYRWYLSPPPWSRAYSKAWKGSHFYSVWSNICLYLYLEKYLDIEYIHHTLIPDSDHDMDPFWRWLTPIYPHRLFALTISPWFFKMMIYLYIFEDIMADSNLPSSSSHADHQPLIYQDISG